MELPRITGSFGHVTFREVSSISFCFKLKGRAFRLRFYDQHMRANSSLVDHFPTPEKCMFLTAAISLLVLWNSSCAFFTL